jgi:hypothetical protein
MSAGGRAVGIDPGLRTRFHAAGAEIAWRDVPPMLGAKRARGTVRPSSRIAHLHDEEARVEEVADGTNPRLVVDSGPVGALVLVLRWDERGPPTRLVPHEAGTVPGFPSGALEAEWGPSDGSPSVLAVPLTQLVALARYALA